MHKMAQELVEEAARTPEKIARVISRWLEANDENARYASVFLKNCDVRTVESVCRHLHPVDAEMVVTRETGELDPFGEENRKVLESMRSELGRMAAQQTSGSRPEPLAFLKQLPDDELATLLENQPARDVALVATQVPAHRLARFFARLDEAACRTILELVPTVRGATVEEFEALRDRLERRREGRVVALVDDDRCVAAMRQVLATIPHAARQLRLARELQQKEPELYQRARRGLLLASDLAALPPRAAKTLFQALDGDKLAAALADVPLDVEALTTTMPAAVQEAFRQARERAFDNDERAAAWRDVQVAVEGLVAAGLISPNELAQAKSRADAPTPGDASAGEAA